MVFVSSRSRREAQIPVSYQKTAILVSPVLDSYVLPRDTLAWRGRSNCSVCVHTASKIELYVGEPQSQSPGTAASQNSNQFKTLGYISLSDNEQTGFRSRELKSVSVDVIAQLIKLVFYHNHINKLNVFNQVSLVALNVIADVPNEEATEGTSALLNEMPSVAAHQSPGQHMDPILLGAINKPAHISLMDDLAFDVAQDPETAQVIRRLEGLKLLAVKGENFELARKMKDVISELQKIGEILCHYEVEKKLAIEREDYETAKEKKLQVEQLRAQIYDHFGVMNLLSGGASVSHQHPRVKNPVTMAVSMAMPSVTYSMPRSTSQVPMPASTGQIPMPHSTSQVPMPVSTSQERPLPTLKNAYMSPEKPVDQVDTVLLSDGWSCIA